MSDKAHKMTDEMIEELEKKISKTYNQAYKETSEKLNKYLKEFQVKDEAQKALVDAGKLSQEDYEKWRYGQILTGKRWKDLNETIAEDLMKADSKSRSIIGDHMPDAYALNRNYAVYSIEKDAQIDTSYTLYNRRAVENLLKDDPNLLPYPRTESPTAQKLRERIDLQWNRQHVNNAVTQGIIQGEPIDKVAKRLMNVVNMDGRAALRNARTMMTGAQNKGRQDGFDELKEKGVDLRERWIATLDDRTRHSHRLLHGEYKDPDTGKYSNGLEYPGDPFGEPEEVYNCRCTELAEVAGFPLDIPTWSPDMGDMTFEEWLGEHEEAVDIEEQAEEWNAWKFVKDNNMQFDDIKDYIPSDDYRNMYLEISGKTNGNETINEYFEKVKNGVYQDEDLLNKFNQITNQEMLSDKGYAFIDKLSKWNIDANPVTKMDVPKPFEQFVKDVGGGDLTKGSCASLSFCYAANYGGFDVRDFRGGDSRHFFSLNGNIKIIGGFKDVKTMSEFTKKPIKTAAQMLNAMPLDTPHILSLGKHCAVVEHTEDGYKYLELQAPEGNGWYKLDSDKLGRRFGATKTSKYGETVSLIDVESLSKNTYFERMMAYINTDESNQMKGEHGRRK